MKNSNEIIDALTKKILILDGAMGTMIQDAKLKEKEEEEIADEEGKKEDEDVKTETTDGSSDFLNFSQQNNVVSKFFDSSFINDMFKNIE